MEDAVAGYPRAEVEAAVRRLRAQAKRQGDGRHPYRYTKWRPEDVAAVTLVLDALGTYMKEEG